MVCQTFAAKHLFAFNDPFLMVNLLQKSSKTDQTIKVNNRPIKIDNRHQVPLLHSGDYISIIRAYIDTVTSN